MKKRAVRNRDGLPREAFAIAGDADDPNTWQLPHHKKSVSRAQAGRIDIEETVDWDLVETALAALSLGGCRRRQVEASPGEIIMAARHLAGHYQGVEKPLPDVLAVIV